MSGPIEDLIDELTAARDGLQAQVNSVADTLAGLQADLAAAQSQLDDLTAFDTWRTTGVLPASPVVATRV